MDSFIFSSRWFASRWFALAAATLLVAATVGCGLPAAPQPPSLHLPKAVRDLKAERAGDQVQLTWTAPKTTTDGLKLKAPIPVRVCVQTTSRVCDTVGNVQVAPGKAATFIHLLPATLAQGPLRSITYQVFAQNAQGHAAAASNDAPALAGEAPPQVTGLTAQVIPQGVLLHWQTAPLAKGTVFEIQRTLLSAPPTQSSGFVIAQKPSQKPEPQSPQKQGSTKKSAPPVTEMLRVQPNSATDPGAALDTSVQWEATYRYVVVRVVKYPAGHPTGAATLRRHSQPSAPVQLQALDTFPPATPQGLVAVVVSAAMNGGRPAIALSWAANSEPDFAQYRVYRRELLTNDMAQANTSAIQIAPAAGAAPNALLVTPTFQDNTVQPGHRYAYSVSAVDLYGNASTETPEVIANLPTAAALSQ